MKNGVITAGFYVTGLIFLSFGISLMILADLGVGPWDAFFVGLKLNLGLTVGTWMFIGGFILILINAFLLDKKPDFSAIITIFMIGIFIDFWLLIVFADINELLLPMRISLLLGGIVIIASGISLYLQANYARNPIDNLMMAVQFRTGKSLSFSKTVIEVSIMIVAIIIGGPIGVGTVIVAFAIGPLIQMFYKPVSRFKARLAS
ncbi:YczE/YyaS/YitT family protein [Thalassobacillus pellis]|uniref:YczE/YyaS/YitT family protein n=1 Tax=Thalassobacillus pellis TaxID=748008 RepID=UPI0019615CF0|nr:membrane protein [Thalassobacillus pellis]MBM7552068.1 putative membrane protein YczE [Thalassobacillus pellis]